jgi:hypothetical protein
MNRAKLKNNHYDVAFKAYHDSDRPRIVLIDPITDQHLLNCTINIKTKVDVKYALIKDYKENEGVYQSLLNAKIIKPSQGHIEIGLEKALICELNVCRVCEDNIHIPMLCPTCVKKIIENGG